MKSTVENLEVTRVRLTVEVPYEELSADMDRAYAEISQQVNVPGFRKGKVPARVIDQRFGRAMVIQEVVNDVLPRLYSEAVRENDIRAMAQPEIEVTEIPNTTGAQGGQLIFTADVDYVPSFEVPEVDERFVVTVDAAEVSEEDVQAELDELRGRFASLKPIKRKAKTGDYVTMDLVATIDGEEVDSVSDVSYEIGAGTMLDGQDKALRGTKAGDEVTFTTTLKGGEHEGEEAEVSINVTSVKERELPEANDDFAQMVSEFDTIDELLEDLKKAAAAGKTSKQALEARDNLIDLLLEKVEILLPEAPVDAEVTRRVGDSATAKTKKEARAEIEKEFRREILAEGYAAKYDVQVSQQELIDYAMEMAQNFGMDVSRLFQDSAQLSAVVADLGRSKALIEVLRQVSIKDTNGADVDLSHFFGDEAPAEEGVEENAEETAEDAE